MALDLNAIMDAIGAQLVGIAGLRVYDYAADNVSPPCAVVVPPTEVEYDVVAGRGADRVVVPVVILVSRFSDRVSRDQLSQYAAGAGSLSVKAAVEGAGGNLGGVAQTVRVTSGEMSDQIIVAAVQYYGVRFDVEVYD